MIGKAEHKFILAGFVERQGTAVTTSKGENDNNSLFYCCEYRRKRRAEKYIALCTKRKTEKFDTKQGF
jgi:hypothetical protein